MPEIATAPHRSASKPTEAPAKADWKMPEVYLGESVYHWYGADSREPTVAIVTALGEKCVSLSLIGVAMYNMQPLDGVRHKDDPDLSNSRVMEDAGFWDYSDFGRRLRGMPISKR